MLCEAENIKSSHPSASAKNKAAGRFRDRLFLTSRPEKACFLMGGKPEAGRRDNGPTAAVHSLQGLPPPPRDSASGRRTRRGILRLFQNGKS